jgi:hypothetical protein
MRIHPPTAELIRPYGSTRLQVSAQGLRIPRRTSGYAVSIFDKTISILSETDHGNEKNATQICKSKSACQHR